MENNSRSKWKVWVTKKSEPIVMESPTWGIHETHEWIWEQIGKRPVSMQRIN